MLGKRRAIGRRQWAGGRGHGRGAGVPWAGMRDKVIHHYFGMNYDIVWTVAAEEIPRLVPRMMSVQEELKG